MMMMMNANDLISSHELKRKIAMIITTDKTFELEKACWIAALMEPHIDISFSLKHFRKPEKSTNSMERLKL